MGILDKLKEQMSQVKLTYLGGHPDLARSTIVYVGREGGNLNLYKMGKLLVSIPISSIKGARLERASSRSAGKTALGAVAGGVIAGPLGMIAGGALGARKKKESTIVLTIQHGPAEVEVLFGGVGRDDVEKKYPRFVNLLK